MPCRQSIRESSNFTTVSEWTTISIWGASHYFINYDCSWISQTFHCITIYFHHTLHCMILVCAMFEAGSITCFVKLSRPVRLTYLALPIQFKNGTGKKYNFLPNADGDIAQKVAWQEVPDILNVERYDYLNWYNLLCLQSVIIVV